MRLTAVVENGQKDIISKSVKLNKLTSHVPSGQLQLAGVSGPGLGLRGAARVQRAARGAAHGPARVRRARAGRRRALRGARARGHRLAAVSAHAYIYPQSSHIRMHARTHTYYIRNRQW